LAVFEPTHRFVRHIERLFGPDGVRRFATCNRRMASSFTAPPQTQARAESGIAAAERLRSAARAIAYGSAVNEYGGV
jgi:hypothetical protein